MIFSHILYLCVKFPRLKHLKAINKYFWKYRWRFLFGILFIVLSNYFKILSPQLTGFVIDEVQLELIQKNAPVHYQERVDEVDKNNPITILV